MSTTRREFLSTTALAAGAALSARLSWGQTVPATEPALWDIPELKTPDSTKKGDMLYRKLGKTGEEVSLLGIGGYHLGTMGVANGTKTLRRAIDAGVTFCDNCWDYLNGRAEEVMGAALQDGYRKKVFLMSKLDGRTRATAESQINDSLKRLQTDVIDLMQIHEVIRETDGEKCFGKDGAMEAVLAAKKAGKIRFIGFTGHKDPEMFARFMDVAKKNEFTFDTAQMPLNPLDAHYHSFARGIVPRMIREGMGVLAMKTLAGGGILSTNTVTAEECFHYAMNLPTSSVIIGIDSDTNLDRALAAVKNFEPLTKTRLGAILAKTRDVGQTGRVEAFKTTTMYDGTSRTPAWMGT